MHRTDRLLYSESYHQVASRVGKDYYNWCIVCMQLLGLIENKAMLENKTGKELLRDLRQHVCLYDMFQAVLPRKAT